MIVSNVRVRRLSDLYGGEKALSSLVGVCVVCMCV